MTTLFLDLETFSPVPLNQGTHAYAEQVEIMLALYAVDNGPVYCWDRTLGGPMPAVLEAALSDPSILVVMQNGGMFDRIVMRHAWRFDLPIERLHDTMVQALCHSLPGSLDTLGEVMKLDRRKDKRGRELIQLFCKPRPKNSKLRRATRETHPTEWAEFIEYGLADVPPMRELFKKLPKWNYSGAELALWHLDQKINSRGVCVDLDLARSAIRAAARAQKDLAARTLELTEGEVQRATQRDKMLAHILGVYGVELPDMQISTLERRIEDPELPWAVRELLAIRLQASKTSSSKYSRLLNGASSDGRLRGLLQFCGASRTGRWAGRLFQPQNLPRPSMKPDAINFGIEAMKADCEDLLFPQVMELCSSAIRGCIVAPPGKKLVVADLSNIEGRMLAWLSGETWKLKAFADYDTIIGWTTDKKGKPKAIRKGPDLYALAYAKAFGVTVDEVMDNYDFGDGFMRQIGKVLELALGYEGGVGAFITFAAVYGIDLEDMAERAFDSIPADVLEDAAGMLAWRRKKKLTTYGLSDRAFIVCESFKRLWRDAHPATASWWKELEEAARLAIQNPGTAYKSRKITAIRTGAWLRLVLPSGRSLCYPSPKIDAKGKISYMGVDQYTRKWQRISTYGGKLAENCTQAAARDVMAYAMPEAEAAGYEIVLTVHDELITEAPDTDDYSADGLAEIMARVPSWAPGLPLAAAGFEDYRYHK